MHDLTTKIGTGTEYKECTDEARRIEGVQNLPQSEFEMKRWAKHVTHVKSREIVVNGSSWLPGSSWGDRV
jgi:hypothetical protein